ncbi:MAG: hypothetical protein AAF738_08750 [Bacteroidota bacterium]
MKKIILFSFLLVLGITSLQAEGNIWHVKTGATGDGSSWKQALGDLSEALEVADYGDQVWVARGKYTPSDYDRDATFEVMDGVQLYGGFAGHERQLEDRNWVNNPTVLSGEIGSSSTTDDNSYTILYTRNVSEETRIDGFTITGGSANGLGDKGDLQRCGGGWFNDGTGGNSSPVVVNCIFTENFGRDGAAVYNFAKQGICQPTIENCQFTNNKADLDGGAMYNDSRRGICNPIIKDCRVVSNEATYGGGILNYTEGGETSPTITGCSFEDNIGYVRGGSIYSSENGGKCEPAVATTYFSDNRATVGKDIYEDKMINRREDGVVASKGKVTKL